MSNLTELKTDPAHFREVLGHYPTGVAVITGMSEEDQMIGMVVGTFTSVSLDPPLVAFLPMKSSKTFAKLRLSGVFTANILANDQEDLCRQIARPGTHKFDGVEWYPSTLGTPRLAKAVASIDCKIKDVIDAGDHYIVIGSVVELAVERPVTPLLFFQGGYGSFSPRSLMIPYNHEVASSVAMAQRIRPAMEILADDLDAEVTLYTPVGEDVIVVATAAAEGLDTKAILGAKFPLMPPLGELFIAWADEGEQKSWLSRAPKLSEDQRIKCLRRLQQTKERGWGYEEGATETDEALLKAMRKYNAKALTPAEQREIDSVITGAVGKYNLETDSNKIYNLASVVAPVRDCEGVVRMVLRLSQLPSGVRRDVLDEWAEQLLKAAQASEEQLSVAASWDGQNAK